MCMCMVYVYVHGVYVCVWGGCVSVGVYGVCLCLWVSGVCVSLWGVWCVWGAACPSGAMTRVARKRRRREWLERGHHHMRINKR